VSLGVTTRVERAQVAWVIAPASLLRDDVIDLGGERVGCANSVSSWSSGLRQFR
jgi:hypothetical protein